MRSRTNRRQFFARLGAGILACLGVGAAQATQPARPTRRPLPPARRTVYTDPLNSVKTFSYDSCGRFCSVRDAGLTSFSYDLLPGQRADLLASPQPPRPALPSEPPKLT